MGNYYSDVHIAREHIHTDITTCTIEDPQLKLYRVLNNYNSKDSSGTGQIRTQSLSQTSTGRMDKQILKNSKITDDKPS